MSFLIFGLILGLISFCAFLVTELKKTLIEKNRATMERDQMRIRLIKLMFDKRLEVKK